VVPAELVGPEPLVVIAGVGDVELPGSVVICVVGVLDVVGEGATPAVVFADVEPPVVVLALVVGTDVVTAGELEGAGAVVVTSGGVVVTAVVAVVVTTGAVDVTIGGAVVVTICGASVTTGAVVVTIGGASVTTGA
jgi:hypothetical protein